MVGVLEEVEAEAAEGPSAEALVSFLPFAMVGITGVREAAGRVVVRCMQVAVGRAAGNSWLSSSRAMLFLDAQQLRGGMSVDRVRVEAAQLKSAKSRHLLRFNHQTLKHSTTGGSGNGEFSPRVRNDSFLARQNAQRDALDRSFALVSCATLRTHFCNVCNVCNIMQWPAAACKQAIGGSCTFCRSASRNVGRCAFPGLPGARHWTDGTVQITD